MSLVVKNALVVTPSGVVHRGAVREDGIIVRVAVLEHGAVVGRPGQGRYVGSRSAHPGVA